MNETGYKKYESSDRAKLFFSSLGAVGYAATKESWNKIKEENS